jgi:hypothetical protein
MSWLTLVERALAAEPSVSITPVGKLSSPGPFSIGALQALITRISGNLVNLLFFLGGTLAVLYILYSGFQLITAGGNSDRVKIARQGIINAIIGIIIMMSTFVIVRLTSTIGETAATIDQKK